MSDCIFCKIGRGDIPAKVVARSDGALAFHDLNPQAPVHVLVIPTRHVSGADAVKPEESGVWSELLGLATSAARHLGVAETGYRLVVNQGNNGGQSVGHLHVHLLGGRRMTWPPG